jgi:hypothetical protein
VTIATGFIIHNKQNSMTTYHDKLEELKAALSTYVKNKENLPALKTKVQKASDEYHEQLTHAQGNQMNSPAIFMELHNLSGKASTVKLELHNAELRKEEAHKKLQELLAPLPGVKVRVQLEDEYDIVLNADNHEIDYKIV